MLFPEYFAVAEAAYRQERVRGQFKPHADRGSALEVVAAKHRSNHRWIPLVRTAAR